MTMTPDPTKVDARHYQVEFENDRIRVLRVKYGPGEKSSMHAHPDSVHVYLTDVKGRFTYPNGKTEEVTAKAGHTMYRGAFEHSPQNLSDKAIELIQIELKH